MKKENWIKLAKTLKTTIDFYDKLNDNKRNLYETYNKETDFIDFQYIDSELESAIIKALDNEYGDFEYLLFDCNFDIKKYCKNVTYKDNTHPKLKDLSDFYDEIINQ